MAISSIKQGGDNKNEIYKQGKSQERKATIFPVTAMVNLESHEGTLDERRSSYGDNKVEG